MQNKHGARLWTLNPREWISLYGNKDFWSWRPDDPPVSSWHVITGSMLPELQRTHLVEFDV